MIKFFITLVAIFITLAQSAAKDSTQEEKALIKISEQLSLIKKIEAYTESQDHGRLHLLEKRSSDVKRLIESIGYANRDTFRAYDVLIITYKNSKQFFESIVTDESKVFIDKLQTVIKEIIADVGEPSGGRISFIVFQELKEKFDELAKCSGSDELKAAIRDLLPYLGRTIATADEQQDTPRTFELSVPLTEKIIAELYPQLRKVSESDDGFSLTVDIIGLVEFYLEFIGK